MTSDFRSLADLALKRTLPSGTHVALGSPNVSGGMVTLVDVLDFPSSFVVTCLETSFSVYGLFLIDLETKASFWAKSYGVAWLGRAWAMIFSPTPSFPL